MAPLSVGDRPIVRQSPTQTGMRYRGSDTAVALWQAHRGWRGRRGLAPQEGWPGERYVLLHSFAHALIRELALECGYTASSIRERIYAGDGSDGGEAMAGVLLYTAAPDSEGTLGGLVSLGEPEHLEPLLRQALERAQLCSSDPLCAHELVASARERILLVSFAAHTLPGLAADLEQAAGRGCTVDVVFETQDDSAGAYQSHEAQPFHQVAGIRRWRWPTEQRPAGGAVLHAKALVVDGQRALVGSANLTQRALTANLEVGVLVGDPAVAQAIEAHVHELMANGVLTRA